MKIKDFFRMEYAQILIYIVFLGLLEVLLFIFEVNYFLMIYLLLIGLILEGIYLCQRYMKKYRYYKKVKAKLDILEQKCMITEMLELPDFAEGEFLYEILQTCNKSMNDEILKYKIEAAGYREYIEMWIHEVKTPLAATRLILENHPSEITRAMDEEMQQINYYLEQALYYARSNSVEKDYLVKELSLKEVVENAVKANAKSLIGNKIKIKIENLDQKIFSDEKWVLFILNQVISNAIKYKKEEAENKRLSEEAKLIKEKLEKETLTFTVRTGNGDRVFGSISVKQIKDELAKKGYKIDKNQIIIDVPISCLGFHYVKVELYQKINAKVKVHVIK